MRAAKNSSSEGVRERHLGAIAPLLDAAGAIDCLSPEQRKQVRGRIVRTLFRTRFSTFRVRLVPVLAAFGMLVIGGAAFAMAERFGLLPDLGAKPPSAVPAQIKQETYKRRRGGARPAARDGTPVVSEATTGEVFPDVPVTGAIALPKIPDPWLFPGGEASAVGSAVLPEAREGTTVVKMERAAGAALETPVKTPRRSARLLAYVAPARAVSAPVIAAPVQPAPAQTLLFPPSPTSPAASSAVAFFAAPATQAVLPSPVIPPLVVAKPAAVSVTPPQLSDLALFGQAMRELRTENNPAAALSVLREHARAFPRSGLAGERNALEVEALLALHRDREALTRLDTMALDELPRSGERFVVRGELRAAARRWLDASSDFDRALTRVSGSPAWYERALWGRGVARLRCGEREAGMADIERYLDNFPNGRFAVEAAKFFPKK